jgi:hypothetical protein
MTMKRCAWIACLGLGLAATAGAMSAPPAEPSAFERVAQATTPSRSAPRVVRPTTRLGVDDLIVEAGVLTGDKQDAKTVSHLRASPYLLWQPDRRWEIRLGAQLDGASQGGGAAPYSELTADIGDTYVRWRDGDTRVTVGAQTIVWGRVDVIPLADRVSRVDLTRLWLDDLPQRRRAQWAARWEQTLGDFKLDAVALAAFRGARLPDERSVWSPINRRTGRIIGVPPDPLAAPLISNATLRRDDGGYGGAAMRLTRTGGEIDYGLTLARTRQSVPYFQLDPTTPSLTAVHPFQTFAGADFELVAGGVTWRAEVGATTGVPVTLAATGQMARSSAAEAVAGIEFFPGGQNTRVTLQLAARSLRTKENILEIKRYVGVNGEVESTFAQGRWKAGVRFASGLNVHDTYVAPRLSFLGWEPHEIFIVARYFNGEPRSLAGFHRDHNMVAVGLKTRF